MLRTRRAVVVCWVALASALPPALACEGKRQYTPLAEDAPDDAGAAPLEDGGARPPFNLDFGVAPSNRDALLGVPPPDAPAGVDAPGAVCGNGLVEGPDETCDDGNATPGDGCSGLCAREPLYHCPTPGAPCVPDVVCGDGRIAGSETCDDGNGVPGDGCSDRCQIEAGWACGAPGTPCMRKVAPRCGDGSLDPGETCDDGNATAGDGCSAACAREPRWSCPAPGQRCVPSTFCGDGYLDAGETCDDGNAVPGDGCSGRCALEPFYACPTPGRPCASTIVCGDGLVVGDEACDDGNTRGGDGCAPDCKRVEAGWTCPSVMGKGGACTKSAVPACGDGAFTPAKACDDGNTLSGDGCSADCTKVEPGYRCPAFGMRCARIGFCGDGVVAPALGETCDDGNARSGDGCSALCGVEADFVCPEAGQPCLATVVCGDGRVGGQEACDDRNTSAGDGCSADCKQVEPGWSCKIPGVACAPAACGDGFRVGSEGCDDGNALDGDGCDHSCVLEPPAPGDLTGSAWACPIPGQPCVPTTCGDHVVEGSEPCDDGKNHSLTDGCTPFCRSVPTCPGEGGACLTACGDGILLDADQLAGQECDDGNTSSGDGCSATCKVERGYHCEPEVVTLDLSRIPVVYRDFKPWNSVANGHPDFERFGTLEDPGIVDGRLDPTDGQPQHASTAGTMDRLAVHGSTSNGRADLMGVVPTTDYFRSWFRDDPAYNQTFFGYLPMTDLGRGVFQFDSPAFFPLENQGWGNFGNPPHNYNFTTEARTWFQYRGNEVLDFTGDDDVFVFINKRLAVDLGGMHTARVGNIVLDARDGTGQVCDFQVPGWTRAAGCGAKRRTVDLGLKLGSVYEMVVFQAERHTVESHYRLTLTQFSATRSRCHTRCSDGVQTPDEECDLQAGNTGAYGGCTPTCKLAPRCGDGIVNGPAGAEECDDGVNRSPGYSGSARQCTSTCHFSSYCGDGVKNGPEACDEGRAGNRGGYGGCAADCTPGPRCGDGLVDGAHEECDDGDLTNGTPASLCGTDCRRKCGNGRLDARPVEECDDGAAANTGAYGACTPACKRAPFCGDGIRQPAQEECDDGANRGDYGTCAPGCKLGPRCGDGIVQAGAGEICDLGAANQASPYGRERCDGRCRPAPYCGDKQVDAVFGERCDDGLNTGLPGSCTLDCKGFVPLPSCGDGQLQGGEQCDDGARNATRESKCDGHCRLKCGNGARDEGEACDDGVNDGRYGTCNPDCTLAAYCGDGVRNGQEACDRGAANEANPYGPQKCSSACTVAPYCGDGRIQRELGEECDGGATCDATCKRRVFE